MKRYIIVFLIVIVLIGSGLWLWYSTNKTDNRQQAQKNTNTTNYQAERSGISQNLNNTNTKNKEKDNKGNEENQITVTKKETEIANFSTKIYNKEEERQNNITITCKAITTKEIAPGEIFSFCDTVGKSTSEKGYQEADIYVDGKKKQGLGGGNCQVSTTLYNAVLQVPELEVIERHKHSGHVPYVTKDKDAAVSYGTYDFKFKNNSQDVIKIIMENSVDNITAKLIKIQA